MRTSVLLLLPVLAQGQTNFSERGFDHFYNLEYDEAISDFELESRTKPNAAGPHHAIAQALLYREMFRNGGLQSELVSDTNSFLRRPKFIPAPGVEKQFESEVKRAGELAQNLLNKNPKDTTALYDACVVSALRSNYDFLVRKAWNDALREATAARKLCNRVIDLDPSNYDARLVPGVHDYVVGSLPWFYQTLGFLAGFRGDRDAGIRTLELVAARGKSNNVDAEILLCVLYRRENQPGKAVPVLGDLLKRYPRNYLLRFELALMYSAAGDSKNALGTMDQIAEMKTAGMAGYVNIPWGKIWYEKGDIQFWYKDLDQSLASFKKVTASTKELDLNTGVLAFMRMGQIYDMKNRREPAIEQYKNAIALAPETEAARDCKRYIASPYKRTQL
jgi:tetratricopeptide (TPR) repeat protein